LPAKLCSLWRVIIITDAFAEPLGLFAQLACVWEVTARKPGNVHRFCDFQDVSYLDFVASAAAIAAPFGQAKKATVGSLVLDAVKCTRRVVATNTNLGIVLLLAPLAIAPTATNLRHGVEQVLTSLSVDDAVRVYEAIRLAAPSGLGRVKAEDVAEQPSMSLREVMRLAEDRDLIAGQYANGFRAVFDDGLPALRYGLEQNGTLEDAIVGCHLHVLAKHPDSLIARKCGKELAEEASRRAAQVIDAGWPQTVASRTAIAAFDSWLRADGHHRNPGTTADLVAASLFVALREGIITLPPNMPWSKRAT
jgi:triphosphoribosyl-dephospho-CoA synthase